MTHQGYIEPQACVASIDENGRGTVWCSTQGHFEFRAATSKILGKDLADLKIVPMEIGGGFGGKTVVYLEPLAVMLSEKSGRPVKMAMSREEVFRATGPASASVARVKVEPNAMAPLLRPRAGSLTKQVPSLAHLICLALWRFLPPTS